jgi:hypothetical protein
MTKMPCYGWGIRSRGRKKQGNVVARRAEPDVAISRLTYMLFEIDYILCEEIASGYALAMTFIVALRDEGTTGRIP